MQTRAMVAVLCRRKSHGKKLQGPKKQNSLFTLSLSLTHTAHAAHASEPAFQNRKENAPHCTQNRAPTMATAAAWRVAVGPTVSAAAASRAHPVATADRW